MPTYDYKCFDCEHEFSTQQKMSEDPIKVCPECGAESVKRLISATAFHLKGSGWYKTDYGSNGSAGTSDKKSEDKASSCGEKANPCDNCPSKKSDAGKSDSAD